MGEKGNQGQTPQENQFNKITAAIAGRVAARREKYVTREVNGFPSVKRLVEPYLIGNASLTLRSSRRRFVRRSAGLQIGNVLETPTTVARDYLTLTYGKGPGVRSSQASAIAAIIKRAPAFPLYATPGQFDDGFYIDVRRAFFSVMCVAGWNVSYYPRKFLGCGKPPLDFPFQENSIARNSLVSVAQARDLTEYYPPHHKPHTITTFNPLLNESISALIRDVLHGIARVAVENGAIYAHTDGFIAPNENAANNIIQSIRDWGLDARIKGRGAGYVLGVANYKVGEMQSKWIDRRWQTNQTFAAIATVEHERWLQNNFSFLAARAKSK